MDVILFRHGIAEERRAELPDAERRLTPKGNALTRKSAAGLARVMPCAPDLLLASPKTRALQTAQILGAALDRAPHVCQPLGLGEVSGAIQLLEQTKAEAVVLVGHDPDLSQLTAQLCGIGQADGLQLKKSRAIELRIST